MLRSSITPMVLLALVGGCERDIGIGDIIEGAPIPRERPQPVVEQTDFITQVTTPETDILFVIDNSCSMSDNQNQLALNFPTFMEFFEGSGLDYHIGAISTDTDQQSQAGVLKESDGLRFITPAVDNAVAVFDGMARLGSGGSATERGLEAAFTMLELKQDLDANQGFYRQDAALHTVFISDEQDQSRDTVIPIGEWITWYDGLKPERNERSASSIVCFPGCGDIVPGTRYLDVTDAIGGVKWNLVDQNWSEVLERLGIQASGLKKEYFLSQTPVVDTIEVSVLRDTGAPQPVEIRFDPAVFDDATEPPTLVSGEWQYNEVRNSITFQNFIPNPLDVVKVNYTLLAATQAQPLDDEEEDEGDEPAE